MSVLCPTGQLGDASAWLGLAWHLPGGWCSPLGDANATQDGAALEAFVMLFCRQLPAARKGARRCARLPACRLPLV